MSLDRFPAGAEASDPVTSTSGAANPDTATFDAGGAGGASPTIPTLGTRLAVAAITGLRIALGVMFLAHGLYLKLFVFTLPGTAAFFVDLGLPGWLAYGVFAAETLGGVMLVLGIQARWAALALVPVLAGATWVHGGNGWMFANPGGGWEYPLYLTGLALAQAMLGDGALVISRSRPLVRRGPAGEGAR